MAREAAIIVRITGDASQVEGLLQRLKTEAASIKVNLGTGGGGRGGATGGGGRRGAGGGSEPTPPRPPSPTGFWANYAQGWQKAGGLGSAVGTVTKYALAYKMVEAAAGAALAPIRLADAFVRDSVKNWTEYEQVMADASRTMHEVGFSKEQLVGVMGDDALRFMEHYRASIKDVAQAQYELGSANFTARQTLETYQMPLKVNIALNGEITQTTRLMTQMLKIHGDQMGDNLSMHDKMVRIGAVVAKTWEVEQMELSDLANSYKYVAGAAKTLKMPIEELVPTLGFLSTYGLRGSIGGTGLNQFFTQTARNIRFTNDQMVQLQKTVRGGGHKIDLGIKAGELTSPLQILMAMGKALSTLPKNFAGRLEIAKILSDMLNIRGARPAQLLTDLENLADLMKKVNDMKGQSTAAGEKYIDMQVKMRQETVEGQRVLLDNNIYALEIAFIKAAAGGATLVATIKNIIKFIQDIKPIVIDVGFKIGKEIREIAAYAGAWSEGKGLIGSRRAASNAGADFEMEGVETRVRKGMVGAALKAKNPGEWEAYRRKQARAAYAYLTRLGVPVGSEGNIKLTPQQQRDSNANRGVPLGDPENLKRVNALASYQLWRNTKYKDIAGDVKAAKNEAAALDINKVYQDQLNQLNNASYTPTTKGGGGAGSRGGSRAPKSKGPTFGDRLNAITDGLTRYEVMLDEVDSAIRGLAIDEDALNRVIQGRVITTADVTKAEKLSGDQVNAQSDRLKVLKTQIPAMEVAYKKLHQAAAGAATTDDKRTARRERDDMGRAIRAARTDIKQTEEAMAQAQELPLTMATNLAKQTAEFSDNAQQVHDYTESIRNAGRAMEKLDRDAEVLQAQYDALGKQWEGSADQAQYLSGKVAELATQQNVLFALYMTGAMGLDQYREALAKNRAEIDKTTAAGDKAKKQREKDNKEREDEIAGYQLKARQTQHGWFRGNPRQMARMQIVQGLDELESELRPLREKFGTETWFADYERTMKADKIAQPWLEARDRVRDEWSSTFKDLFSNLIADGEAPWKAAAESIIGSIQSQMIEQFTDRYLTGLFDTMASAETGLAKPETIAANNAALALDQLTVAVQSTTAAFAGGVPGVPGGAGAGGAVGALLAAGAGVGFVGIPTAATASAGGKSPITIGPAVSKSSAGRWGKGVTGAINMALQQYAQGSMLGGISGSIFGRDAESSSMYGGLGGIAGYAIGGPLGGLIGGFLGGLLGKKKKKAAAEDPSRDMYGMPTFEWESYLYNLYENEKGLDAYKLGSTGVRLSESDGRLTSGAPVLTTNNNGNITININGGDTAQVKKVVNDALSANFGSFARATALAAGG